MTSIELLDACKANLDRVNLPVPEETRLKEWINQVQREDLCNIHSFDWMERIYTVACTEGQDFYACERQEQHKDLLWVKFRTDSDNEFSDLSESSHRALSQQLADKTNGTPTAWTRWWDEGTHRKGIKVRRRPDGSFDPDGYEFQFLATEYPKRFTFDKVEENLLTRDHSKSLEILVTARGYLFYGQPQEAAAMQEQVNIHVDKLLQGERSRDKQANMTFRMNAAAGRPSAGIRKGKRNIGGIPYSWLTGS
jgi:hypothetical protein